jgi:molybdate transport repressor ModE-like protein
MASTSPRSALSPENLGLLEAIARLGSMAAAARELGMVPSALTYRVRQVEDALDVLLFDRSARRAQLTPAGAELLRAGQYLLNELDAVAQRVKRVALGWEPQLTIATDAVIARSTLFELCEAFYATGSPTQLRIRAETLSGTMEALQGGLADLAIGVAAEVSLPDIQIAPMGQLRFEFVVAPHHPLAHLAHSISDEEIRPHRAVAVADSTQRGAGQSFNILPRQDVLTVPTMLHKLEAQLRGMGCGFLPLPLAQPYINAGLLVVKTVQRPNHAFRVGYAWRRPSAAGGAGQAMRWWLERLEHRTTRSALLENHHMG